MEEDLDLLFDLMVFVLENYEFSGKGSELIGKNGGCFLGDLYLFFVFFRLIFEVKIWRCGWKL